MRLREDFEPASGVKRRPVQCRPIFGDLLVPYSTLALCSGANHRERPSSEPPVTRHASVGRVESDTTLQ